MRRSRRPWAGAGWSVVLVALTSLPTGCIVGELLQTRRSLRAAAEYALIGGTVTTREPSDSWLVIYVSTVPCDEDWRALLAAAERGDTRAPRGEWSTELVALGKRLVEKSTLAQHVVLERSGIWYTSLPPGCYGVGAFEDSNRNYRYDDEPVAMASADTNRLVELSAGDRRENIDLTILPEARLDPRINPLSKAVADLTVRSYQEQLRLSIDQVTIAGEVVELDDPRFSAENGRLGYFDPFTFMWKSGPGIYFLEPHDPDKIPVLFVHGATGHPGEFGPLIEGLDRDRFQPWLAYYPSGIGLAGVSSFFSQLLMRLRLQTDFESLAVVAHSMGGLVSRALILEHHERARRDPVRVFIAISTPWGGLASAAKGVERSPVVVPSWRDVTPNSKFIRELFFQDPEAMTARRRLPEQVSFHALFGVEDRTISAGSAVRWEAMRDADERWPLVYDHTAILRSPEAAALIGEILSRELP